MDEKSEVRKKEMYFYTEQGKKVIKEYKFWRTPHDTWRVMKTVYQVDEENSTVEMTIPDAVLNKMLTDSAKESLADE